MARVLVSSPLAGDAIEPLLAAHDVEVGSSPTGFGKQGLLPRLADKAGLIALLTDRIDEELLSAAPELRVVANHAVGVDNVDLEACRRRGIVVTNTKGVLTDATADFTMALLLATARRVVEADALARSGRWRGWSPTELLGVPLSGARLGLIGCGRIGQAVARRAGGFGMSISYTQPRRLSASLEGKLGLHYAPLDELLAESDFVSIHCPLSVETQHLLSRARLATMKPGAIVVNTSRGACIDQEALAEAVGAGRLAGAGLDVFEAEPAVPESLRALSQIVLAPHVASADLPTRAAMGRLCVDGVLAVLSGAEPSHRVV